MAIEITMPQLSDTMDKGTILTWFRKEGDKINRGDALAEVSTDKANLEIESFHEGTLLQIRALEGTVVSVGEVIAVIGEAGEIIEQTISPVSATNDMGNNPSPVKTETGAAGDLGFPLETPAEDMPTTIIAESSTADLFGARLKISPLARNLAAAHGLNPAAVVPTGEGGRIVRRDVERHLAEVSAPKPASAGPLQAPKKEQSAAIEPAAVQPLSRMRQAIASNMVISKTTIPHFYMTAKAEVEALLQIKETLKTLPAYEGITLGHLALRAVVLALQAVPRVNACYRDNSLVQHGEINLGIVTALDEGLLIPVIHEAGSLSLAEIVAEAKGLIQRARAGKPKANDLVGGTFTISNLGPFNIENFSAVILPGQGAVLAASGIQEEAVANGGAMYPARVMRFTLSADHRVIDGVVAAKFLTELVRVIENPVLLVA